MSHDKYRILVINPGATSTKLAVFDEKTMLFKKTVEHKLAEIQIYEKIFDQYEFRLELVLQAIAEEKVDVKTIKAVVGRGGLLKPVQGGTYRVNEKMVEDLKKAERGQHASNLGAVLAFNLGSKFNIPAFIVDPVAVDEIEDVARITGLPELKRKCLSHALNIRAVARSVAEELGKDFVACNFIVVHLGTGISIAALKKGKMVDACNAKEEGPFSVDRCGGLPASQLVKLCYSGQYTCEELLNKLIREAGIYAYLGTKDVKQVEKMIAAGDEQAKLVLDAFIYQVTREIGAMAAVLQGHVDRIIFTGGMAYSARIVEDLLKRVKFIAPVVVKPGEEELQSLALGALRVLKEEEKAHEYV